MTLAIQNAPRTSLGPIVAQTLLVAMLMAAALLAPPASGAILLLPLARADSGAMLQRALDTGARLEGAGPIPGSFVVLGDRDRLAFEMMRNGVLVLSARSQLCDGKGAGQA